MAKAWPSSGGGEDRGEPLPGSGSALASFPRAKTATRQKPQELEDTKIQRRTHRG